MRRSPGSARCRRSDRASRRAARTCVPALRAARRSTCSSTSRDLRRSGRRPGHATPAHDFVWRHRAGRVRPDGLPARQLVAPRLHLALSLPLSGLAVLHDAHLHHARAARSCDPGGRRDYRREFALESSGRDVDLAELAIAGFDSHLYYHWPMTRLVVHRRRGWPPSMPRARARQLSRGVAGRRVESIRLGHGVLVSRRGSAKARTRQSRAARHSGRRVVFGCFGGLSPDKRIPQVLTRLPTRPARPGARLLLAGARADTLRPRADIERARHRAMRVTLTGYLESDDDLTDAHRGVRRRVQPALANGARDVGTLAALPRRRHTPRSIVDLAHLAGRAVARSADVAAASATTRTSREHRQSPSGQPIRWRVAIDILDEDHSLRLAMRRLARDAALRRALGPRGAAATGDSEHSPASDGGGLPSSSSPRRASSPVRRRHCPAPADDTSCDDGRPRRT